MSLPAFCSATVNAYRKRVLSACHHAPRTCIIVFLSLVALHTSIRAQVRHNQALQVSLQKQLLDCTDSASYGLGAIITRVFRLSSAAVACPTASLLRKEVARMRWVLAFWGLFERFVFVCIAVLMPPFICAAIPYLALWLAIALEYIAVDRNASVDAISSDQQVHFHVDDSCEAEDHSNDDEQIDPVFFEDIGGEGECDSNSWGCFDNDDQEDEECSGLITDDDDEVDDVYESVSEVDDLHELVDEVDDLYEDSYDACEYRSEQEGDESDILEGSEAEVNIVTPIDEDFGPEPCTGDAVRFVAVNERYNKPCFFIYRDLNSDDEWSDGDEESETKNTLDERFSDGYWEDDEQTVEESELPPYLQEAIRKWTAERPIEETIAPSVVESRLRSVGEGSNSACDDSCETLVHPTGPTEPVVDKDTPTPRSEVPRDAAEHKQAITADASERYKTAPGERVAETRTRAEVVATSLERPVTGEDGVFCLSELIAYNHDIRQQVQDVAQSVYNGYPRDENIVMNLIHNSRRPTQEELEEVRAQAQRYCGSTGIVPSDEEWATGLLTLMAQRDISAQLEEVSVSNMPQSAGNFASSLLPQEAPVFYRNLTEGVEHLEQSTSTWGCRQALLNLTAPNEAIMQMLQVQIQAQTAQFARYTPATVQCEYASPGSQARYPAMPYSSVAPINAQAAQAPLGWDSGSQVYVSAGAAESRDVDMNSDDAIGTEVELNGDRSMDVDRVQEPSANVEMEVDKGTLLMEDSMGQVNNAYRQTGTTHSTSSQMEQDSRVGYAPGTGHAPEAESQERTRDPRRRPASSSAPPPTSSYSNSRDPRNPYPRDGSSYYSRSQRGPRYSPGQEAWNSHGYCQPMDDDGGSPYYTRPHRDGYSPDYGSRYSHDVRSGSQGDGGYREGDASHRSRSQCSPVRNGRYSQDEGPNCQGMGRHSRSIYDNGDRGSPYRSRPDNDPRYSPRYEERNHDRRDNGKDCQPKYDGEDMTYGSSYRPHSPRDTRCSPVEEGEYEYEERYDRRDEMERGDRDREYDAHPRGCDCADCQEIFGNGSSSSSNEDLSNSVQRRNPREADAHDPASHGGYDDQFRDRGDYDYGNEECEGASRAHEEGEPEDQQAFEMRMVDEYWEYKDAGLPVPREIQETLDRPGIVTEE